MSRGHVVKIIADAHAPDARLEKEIKSLVAGGYTVDVLCWDRSNDHALPAHTENAHGTVQRYKRPSARGHPVRFLFNLFRFYFWGLRKARMARPDYIHVHTVQVLPLGVALKALLDRPLVYDVHEITEVFGRGLWRRLGAVVWRGEQALIRSVDLVLTVSEGLRQRYASIVRPTVEVVELLNCLPVPEQLPAPPLPGRRPFVLGRIGNLRPRSRIDMIADILIGLNARGYQVRLRYAGMSMGRYGDTVAREHERMGGLAEYIPWVGIDDFPSFYADVDAVLNLHECGDPLHDRLAHFSKVFEAMALGVPAVINDFPSMTPMIEGAEAGVVVKEFTAEAFIEAISELIDDPKRLGRLRRNALRLAKERINWGVMEARLLAGYARLGARHEVGPEPARVDPVPDFGTPLREAEGAAIAGAGESKPERPVRGEA